MRETRTEKNNEGSIKTDGWREPMKQDQNKRSWKHVAGDNVVKWIGSPWQSGMELLQQLHYTHLSVNTASFSCSSNSRWSERKTNIKPTLVPQNNLTVKNTESKPAFCWPSQLLLLHVCQMQCIKGLIYLLLKSTAGPQSSR